MIAFSCISSVPAVLKKRDWVVLAAALTRVLRLRRARVVGVTFVSEEKMHALNKKFRGKDRPTDVLSFVAAEVNIPKKAAEDLGDLVICPAYAAREAARRGLSLREELLRLLAHGVLHLAGYDHATEAEETIMFAKQERCVAACLAL
jgi:probable rRNA maturation factor